MNDSMDFGFFSEQPFETLTFSILYSPSAYSHIETFMRAVQTLKADWSPEKISFLRETLDGAPSYVQRVRCNRLTLKIAKCA